MPNLSGFVLEPDRNAPCPIVLAVVVTKEERIDRAFEIERIAPVVGGLEPVVRRRLDCAAREVLTKAELDVGDQIADPDPKLAPPGQAGERPFPAQPRAQGLDPVVSEDPQLRQGRRSEHVNRGQLVQFLFHPVDFGPTEAQRLTGEEIFR